MQKIKEYLNTVLEVANDNGIEITGENYVQLVTGILLAESTTANTQNIDNLTKQTEMMMKSVMPPQEFKGELVKGTVTELGD